MEINKTRPQIAIFDFGSQLTHLIARRIRELQVYSELYSFDVKLPILQSKHIVGVIFSGGPASVFDTSAPHISSAVWKYILGQKIPIFGICYGLQEIIHFLEGEVQPSVKREFGFAKIELNPKFKDGNFLSGITVDMMQVWMSHADKVLTLPKAGTLFDTLASTSSCEHALVQCKESNIYGCQFHPEVSHTICGRQLLKNFIFNVCKAKPDWKMGLVLSDLITSIRKTVGDSHVIGAVSGGVDSSVAATLLNKAIGPKFHAVFVDNGLLRLHEGEEVLKRLKEKLGINLLKVDASSRFLEALTAVVDPEEKRKVIGRLFIEIFQEEAETLKEKLEEGAQIDFLLQGTLYPDVIESTSHKGPSAKIKSHHNVGGLPDDMSLKLIEPLRDLFKDEVRELGRVLGIDSASVNRHPFPGPGLAIRVLGDITVERLDILRQCDFRLIEELRKANVYDDIAQAFCVFLPVKAVGVMGDGRTYENVITVRCVTSSDFMTADWYKMDYELLGKISNRIINEVSGINRVCYDVSSKPPATIEWE